MKLSKFKFNLPEGLLAEHPTDVRDESRMMVVHRDTGKIEHKMFCFISQNWRGKPLIDTATVINLIGNTKTKTGLEIKAKLDERIYQKGIKVSDKEMAKINLKMEKFPDFGKFSMS